jgi:hypothetical protein
MPGSLYLRLAFGIFARKTIAVLVFNAPFSSVLDVKAGDQA